MEKRRWCGKEEGDLRDGHLLRCPLSAFVRSLVRSVRCCFAILMLSSILSAAYRRCGEASQRVYLSPSVWFFDVTDDARRWPRRLGLSSSFRSSRHHFHEISIQTLSASPFSLSYVAISAAVRVRARRQRRASPSFSVFRPPARPRPVTAATTPRIPLIGRLTRFVSEDGDGLPVSICAGRRSSACVRACVGVRLKFNCVAVDRRCRPA